jgi:hypothetical protein
MSAYDGDIEMRTITMWRPIDGTTFIAIRWIVAYQVDEDIIIETIDGVTRRFPITPSNMAEMKKLR